MNKLFKKRLELLAEIGPVIESSGGNYYVVLSEVEHIFSIDINQCSVTKSQLGNLFKQISYIKKQQQLLMLTKKNKLVYKSSGHGAKFENLGIKRIRELKYDTNFLKILKLFLYNKKCEWIVSCSNPADLLLYYNLLKSFKSLKELLKYLGYTTTLHNLQGLPNLIIGYNFKNKTNVIETPFNILNDTARMIVQNGFDNYYNSEKSIQNIHDEIVIEINKKSLDSYSTEVIRPKWAGEVDLALYELNIKFNPLDNARKLAENGFKQHHCIGSYAHRLSNEVFYELNWAGEIYSLRSNLTTLLECRGKYNSSTPAELNDLLNKFYKKGVTENMPF